MGRIWVLHGVNLNLLGKREPEHYGTQTIEEINRNLEESAQVAGCELQIHQSNHEGEMVEWIHQMDSDDFLVINPGAWTHYSYAIRDAITSVKVPAVEVHLSNIHKREEFRKNSVIAPVCLGQISGLGMNSYLLALQYAIKHLSK